MTGVKRTLTLAGLVFSLPGGERAYVTGYGYEKPFRVGRELEVVYLRDSPSGARLVAELEHLDIPVWLCIIVGTVMLAIRLLLGFFAFAREPSKPAC